MPTSENLALPDERERAGIAPASAYRVSQPVWVYRQGWRPGVTLFGSERAVSVRYRQNVGLGTSVDTVLPIDLAPRTEPDPYLDRAIDGQAPLEEAVTNAV